MLIIECFKQVRERLRRSAKVREEGRLRAYWRRDKLQPGEVTHCNLNMRPLTLISRIPPNQRYLHLQLTTFISPLNAFRVRYRMETSQSELIEGL